MSKEFTPADFDVRAALDGLHTAMGFGTPTRVEDRATFYLPGVAVTDPDPADLRGVPFDPNEKRTITDTKIQVPCAVEFFDARGIVETFGVAQPTKIKITLLDPDYQQIKKFLYVVAGGDKYIKDKIQPPLALGTLDVWVCWANAENER